METSQINESGISTVEKKKKLYVLEKLSLDIYLKLYSKINTI